jgi:methylthioribose-1-phosphate isomerase
MGSLIAIRYDRASGLSLLDQRKLPFETAWLPTPTPQDAWQQIKDMVVRGAPVRAWLGQRAWMAWAEIVTLFMGISITGRGSRNFA